MDVPAPSLHRVYQLSDKYSVGFCVNLPNQATSQALHVMLEGFSQSLFWTFLVNLKKMAHVHVPLAYKPTYVYVITPQEGL